MPRRGRSLSASPAAWLLDEAQAPATSDTMPADVLRVWHTYGADALALWVRRASHYLDRPRPDDLERRFAAWERIVLEAHDAAVDEARVGDVAAITPPHPPALYSYDPAWPMLRGVENNDCHGTFTYRLEAGDGFDLPPRLPDPNDTTVTDERLWRSRMVAMYPAPLVDEVLRLVLVGREWTAAGDAYPHFRAGIRTPVAGELMRFSIRTEAGSNRVLDAQLSVYCRDGIVIPTNAMTGKTVPLDSRHIDPTRTGRT